MRAVQYLQPALAESGRWDVLVGHYLGVDHAGHTADVQSPAMAAKLTQMDGEVAQVGARRCPRHCWGTVYNAVPSSVENPLILAHGYESILKVKSVHFAAPLQSSAPHKSQSSEIHSSS